MVVPVYNGAATLRDLHARLCAVLEPLGSFEIILVDDGSADSSFRVMRELRHTDPRVRVVQLMRNFGQHNATLCGLARAQGRLVITLDDDLQNPPEEIPKLLAALTDDVDCVRGVSSHRQHPPLRKLASATVSRIAGAILHQPGGVRFTPFTIMRLEVVRAVLMQRTAYVFLPALVLLVTSRITEIEVRHDARQEGASGYSLWRLIRVTSNLILNHSNLPLRAVSVLGSLVAITALAGAVWIALRRIRGDPSPLGWASLFVATMFLGGLTLLSIGIVGEYLLRVLSETTHRPTYVVRREDA